MPHPFGSAREALLQSVHVFLYVLEVVREARSALDGGGYTQDEHDRAWTLFWVLQAVSVPGSTIAAQRRGWRPPVAAAAAFEELEAWYARWSAVARETVREPAPRQVMGLDAPEAPRAFGPSVHGPDLIATPIDAALLADLQGRPAPAARSGDRDPTGRNAGPTYIFTGRRAGRRGPVH